MVRGQYLCDAQGEYPLARDGSLILSRVQCSQVQGRCAFTLCALHRLNRRGPGTWYPDRILRPLPAGDSHPPRTGASARSDLSGLY